MLRSNTFRGEGWGGEIEIALNALSEVGNLILDLRSNTGGTLSTTEDIAGRFISQAQIYAHTQTRAGQGHNNLTLPETVSIQPKGQIRLVKPIVILTNRGTVFDGADR